MFSQNAFEALYTYIGLHLHETSIRILTSYRFFAAIMLITFALALGLATWKYLGRHLPAGLGSSGGGLSKIVKIIACLFIGMTLLRGDSQATVKNYKNQSWHSNAYIKNHRSHTNPTYRVSLLFNLLSQTGEDIARFTTEVVDAMFISTNSQAESPDYFYKAVMFAGSSTIDDPNLKSKVNFYTEECFDLLIPLMNHDRKKNVIDRLLSPRGNVRGLLDKKTLRMVNGVPYTCLNLSDEINRDLRAYARTKTAKMPTAHITNWGASLNVASRFDDKYLNYFASSALANHYKSKHESLLGIHKASQPEWGTARIFQYVFRLFGYDGALSLLGQSDKHGAALTAERSLEFSELLHRAPHIKGFTKMMLIAVFPWLVFFLIVGRWRVLVFWTAVYCSVLLWEPMWTLCYHIITHIALSSEAIASFDSLGNGFSLYSAELITSRMYYAYSIYAWVQLFSGPLPTLILGFNIRSLLAESREETAPPVINQIKNYSTGQVLKSNSKKSDNDEN